MVLCPVLFMHILVHGLCSLLGFMPWPWPFTILSQRARQCCPNLTFYCLPLRRWSFILGKGYTVKHDEKECHPGTLRSSSHPWFLSLISILSSLHSILDLYVSAHVCILACAWMCGEWWMRQKWFKKQLQREDIRNSGLELKLLFHCLNYSDHSCTFYTGEQADSLEVPNVRGCSGRKRRWRWMAILDSCRSVGERHHTGCSHSTHLAELPSGRRALQLS